VTIHAGSVIGEDGLGYAPQGEKWVKIPQVGRAVIDLAGGETTTALPHVLPHRRGVPTLWEDDTRVVPPAKVAWSDLTERQQREFLHEFIAVAEPGASAALVRQREIRPRPVELAFIEGGVTQSDASALVLGAFANVEPAGAALAMDTMLHGAISDLARRRAISAAAGEVFVLPVGRRGLAARLVVFAGLGDFGLYGPDIQRLAAANVTRTLALAGIGDFAMVLWGTASGVDVPAAARAQLEGVLTALADLAPELRLRRITILSRSARRLEVARLAAEDLLRALEPGGDLDAGAARAAELRLRDGIFPNVLDSVEAALQATSVVHVTSPA